MAITVKNIIPRKLAENTQTTQYTASGVTTVIDKFTVTNTTGTAASISVNLPPLSGSPGAANCVLSVKSVQPGETYNCPEVVGQALAPGGFISTLAGTASALTISATGREIS